MAMLLLLLRPLPRDMDRVSSKRYEMIGWAWRRHCMIAVGKKQLNTTAVDRDSHELCAQCAGIRVVFYTPFHINGEDNNLPLIYSTRAWRSSA